MTRPAARPSRVTRGCLLASLAAALAMPATSLGAPGWQAPVYPALPEAGVPPLYGSLALAAGPGGKAALLYRGEDDALWTVSRASTRAKWTTARRWRPDARLGDGSRIAAALGTRLTALWTTRRGGLATATGGLASGGRPATIRSRGRVASPALSLTSAGVAYSFAAGPSTGTAFGGTSPVTTPLRPVPPIGPTGRRNGVQTGTDSAGNMTAAWIGPAGGIQVATKAASASTWSPATTLPGSTRGAFALAVAPGGASAVVYSGNTVRRPFVSEPGTYLAHAEVLVVQRAAGEAAFGAPQVAGVFSQDQPPDDFEFVDDWPTRATVAINDTTLVLGFVVESFAEDPVGYYVTRAAIGAPLPPPTRVTDPKVRGLSEVTSWSLSGVDIAIDARGDAAFVAGGSASQGVTDSLFATASTASSPGWTRMTDIARCLSRAGGTGIADSAVALAPSPSGGLVAAWVCSRDLGDAIGLSAFDSRGRR